MRELENSDYRVEQISQKMPELRLYGDPTLGFLPAFQDIYTQEVHLSVNANGSPAHVHVLDHLPEHWVLERDEFGQIAALKEGIIAGFMRQERFYSRADLANLPCDG